MTSQKWGGKSQPRASVCVQRTPGFRVEPSEARGKREKLEELMESRQETVAASWGHQQRGR